MRQLRAPNMVSAEYRRTNYLVTIEAATTEADILEPAFWANVAGDLRTLDRLDCWWEDGSRYVELLVVKATRTEAAVSILLDKKLTGTVKVDLGKELDKYEVAYGGPTVGYRITRKADRVVVRSDVSWNEDEARRFLLDYVSQQQKNAPRAPEPAADAGGKEKKAAAANTAKQHGASSP